MPLSLRDCRSAHHQNILSCAGMLSCTFHGKSAERFDIVNITIYWPFEFSMSTFIVQHQGFLSRTERYTPTQE